jgi:type IV secretion system protein TrbL
MLRPAPSSWVAEALGALAEAALRYALERGHRLGRPRNLARAALVVFCMASAFAFGQASGDPTPQVQTSTPASYPFSIDSTITAISSKVSSTLTALEQNAKLQGIGQLLTAFFLLAMLVWATLKSMAGGRGLGELVGEWIPIFFGFGVVTLFLDKAAGGLIVSTMDGIGAAIGGGNMSSLEAAIRTSAEPVFRAIAAVINQPRITDGAGAGGEGGVLGFVATIAASGASMVMGAIAKVVTAFILVMAGVVMVAHIIMAYISTRLVLALAPVMVPFLLFKPMSWLFESWLRFLLGACMLKIVVAFLLNVVAGLLSGMSEHAQSLYSESYRVTAIETLHVDILMLGMTMVFALLAMLLLMQAPGIAAGLLAGSAGQAGFSGIRGLTHATAARVASSGTSSFGVGVGAATVQSARNTRAYVQARRDAAGSRPASLLYRNPESKGIYAQTYRRYANGRASPPAPPAKS